MEPYCDVLSYIYKLFQENPPMSSAQLVMLHLLHENYCLGNNGTVHLSDRELGLRTRLSKQSITEAKRTLKNRGWIDFKTDRDKPHKATAYTILLSEKVGQTQGQRVGQTLGQRVGHQSFVPYTLKQAQTSSDTSIYSSKDDDDSSNLNFQKKIKPNNTKSSSSSAIELNEVKDDDDDGLVFRKLWEVRTESKLGEQEAREIEELGKLYGYRIFEKVLTKCIRFKGSDLHLNYFLAALNDEAEKKRKGGEQVERRKQPVPDKRTVESTDAERFPWE